REVDNHAVGGRARVNRAVADDLVGAGVDERDRAADGRNLRVDAVDGGERAGDALDDTGADAGGLVVPIAERGDPVRVGRDGKRGGGRLGLGRGATGEGG